MRHRRLPSFGRHLRRALTRATAFTVAGGLVVLGGAGVAHVAGADRPDAERQISVPQPRSAEQRLMSRYDCSVLGYDDGSSPRSAIVRGADGRLRVVDFERGWAVHTARGEARLVAVCLRPAR